MKRARSLTVGMLTLTAISTLASAARSEGLDVLNGQVNLDQSISEINVTVEYGGGADAQAASVGNSLTGAAEGIELNLLSAQVNEGAVSATANVTTTYVPEGYTGAETAAVGNSLVAGTTFTGGYMGIVQENNANVTATSNITNGESYDGLIYGGASAVGNSAMGSSAGTGNQVDLTVDNLQTNNSAVRATVNIQTTPNQPSAYIQGSASAIGNAATFGATW